MHEKNYRDLGNISFHLGSRTHSNSYLRTYTCTQYITMSLTKTPRRIFDCVFFSLAIYLNCSKKQYVCDWRLHRILSTHQLCICNPYLRWKDSLIIFWLFLTPWEPCKTSLDILLLPDCCDWLKTAIVFNVRSLSFLNPFGTWKKRLFGSNYCVRTTIKFMLAYVHESTDCQKYLGLEPVS